MVRDHASLPCPFDPIPFSFAPIGYRSAVSEPELGPGYCGCHGWAPPTIRRLLLPQPTQSQTQKGIHAPCSGV